MAGAEAHGTPHLVASVHTRHLAFHVPGKWVCSQRLCVPCTWAGLSGGWAPRHQEQCHGHAKAFQKSV